VTVVEAITLAIALLGAVLGIINTWHALDASRVKLKVVPGHAIPVGGANPSIDFYITVTNLSTFPVTIREVGIIYGGMDKRGVFVNPFLADGGSWPRRLEPRSAISVYGQRPDPIPGHPIRRAYAETDCGIRRYGQSPALRQIAVGR
jgi:hypothetical protein